MFNNPNSYKTFDFGDNDYISFVRLVVRSSSSSSSDDNRERNIKQMFFFVLPKKMDHHFEQIVSIHPFICMSHRIGYYYLHHLNIA
ncbi:hypothetical protein DERF_002446 [Dermatophagoides farinae]|uniref:Uncharacterized protein n=1 Tax=Dermatophagoides farinae TaxID=6954 RepID=A0A922LAH7_DERFA|nr:hypothetical protein DERF_002446 [Dermatophagoides farinae]